ncbi:MAG: agmatinase [Candidatus Bathyarchaeota archaeon]|nr:agmatinase [Candidatus Bathyarchaeota archaeon]MDH5495514.1 agmatinase [Candidatus Bathyarchaeota archaeon]
MSYFELYVSHSNIFSGYQKAFNQADYVVVGVPFDVTSTYRTGSRFAPLAIREASLNIETYSFRSNLDIEDLKIHDLGDLHISNDVEKTLKRLEYTVKDLLKTKKKPILIGGEHTLTLGATQGIGGKNTAVISLDAHLDLRSQYMDLATSHTTFMQRLNEHVKPEKIVEVGTRAVCKEELTYAKKAGIQYFTTKQIREKGLEATVKAVRKAVENCKRTYLTIDMDVLDPAFAPAVQNPEPDGVSIQVLLDLICNFCDSRLVGLDLVEVAPPYDKGVTAIQAAKILFEALCRIEKVRKS